MKKYVINYGYGIAVLYTSYEPLERFYTLANTCFGIRKSIACVEILNAKDAPDEEYERLEFNGDAYIWRADGARKLVKPESAADKEWDTSYCDICRKE